MKVAVWDTYVSKEDGELMHFDIIVPDSLKDPISVYSFGKEYLESKNMTGIILSQNECKFCHIETPTKEVFDAISTIGYYIKEMEGCN